MQTPWPTTCASVPALREAIHDPETLLAHDDNARLWGDARQAGHIITGVGVACRQ